jgi:hypothetical protein
MNEGQDVQYSGRVNWRPDEGASRQFNASLSNPVDVQNKLLVINSAVQYYSPDQ